MADIALRTTLFQGGVTTKPGSPGTTYAEVRIPAVIRCNDGTLVAFAEGREAAGDFGNIDIICRRSTDGGATWGSAILVQDNGTVTAGNPVPIINSAGELVLVFIKQSASGGGNRNPWVVKSTDNGATWGTATDLSSIKPGTWTWIATGPGHGIRTTSGRLICPVNANISTTYLAGCMYSDDGGTTWTMGTMNSDGTGVYNYNESIIAQKPNGDLVMFSRNENGSGPDRIISVSTNGGSSWGAPADSGMVATNVQGSVVQHNGATHESSPLIFSGSDDADSRHSMVLRMSTNGGTSWTKTHDLWRVEDAAYSDIVVTGRNSVGVLYEHGTTNAYQNITWERVPLRQITQVGSATNSTTGSSVADSTTAVANKPTGTASGDVLIACFTGNSVLNNVTPPSGFTQFASASNGVLHSRLYYKVAGGSEGSSYTFTTSSSGPLQLAITAWRNVDNVNPIIGTATTSNNAGGSEPQTGPTLSTDHPDGRMFHFRSAFITGTTFITFTGDNSTTLFNEILETNQSPAANGVSGSRRTQALYTPNSGFESSPSETKGGYGITSDLTETANVNVTFALRSAFNGMDVGATLAPVTSSFAGDHRISATLDTSLAPVTSALAGDTGLSEGPLSTTLAPVTSSITATSIGGDWGSTLAPVSSSFSAGVQPTGSFSSTLAPVTISLATETQPFGEHVIVVEPDHRAFLVTDDDDGLIPIKRSQVTQA